MLGGVGVDSHQVEHATSRRHQQGVRSSEEPFMAALGHGRRGVIVGAWSIFVLVTWLFALCRVWKVVNVEGVEITMADRGHSG